MKTLPLSLLLIIGLAAYQSSYQKDQIRKANIKRVTSLVGISTKQKFVSDYDQRGNLIRRVGYGSDGSPLLQETYKYDDKDNVVEAVIGGKKRTYSYRYTPEGHVLEARQFDSEGRLRERAELRHDGSGNMIEQSKFGANGNLFERQLNTYQRDNAVSQTLIYDPDGNLTSRITYEYESDRVARKSTYGPNGNLVRRNVYKRDQKGLVIEDLQTNEKGELVDRTTSEYEFHPQPISLLEEVRERLSGIRRSS
jgi:antitoxin component YwqK of YwqJK toxin-antitoxin module